MVFGKKLTFLSIVLPFITVGLIIFYGLINKRIFKSEYKARNVHKVGDIYSKKNLENDAEIGYLRSVGSRKAPSEIHEWDKY